MVGEVVLLLSWMEDEFCTCGLETSRWPEGEARKVCRLILPVSLTGRGVPRLHFILGMSVRAFPEII